MYLDDSNAGFTTPAKAAAVGRNGRVRLMITVGELRKLLDQLPSDASVYFDEGDGMYLLHMHEARASRVVKTVHGSWEFSAEGEPALVLEQ